MNYKDIVALGIAGPAGLIVAPLLGLALIKKSRNNSGAGQFVSVEEPAQYVEIAPSPSEKFEFMLASLMFSIDGVVSDQEQQFLNQQANRFGDVKDRVDKILSGKEMYREIKSWFSAVKDLCDVSELSTKLSFFADLDEKRTEEESALIVQIINMIEGGPKLPLYLGGARPEEGSFESRQDFFEHISQEEYGDRCGSLGYPFEKGTVYVEDPFDIERLMPLDEKAFEDAQDNFLDGLLLLLKQIGAKSVRMTQREDKSSATSSKGKVDINVGVKLVSGSLKVDGSSSASEDWHKSEDVEATFDGAGMSVIGRIFVGGLESKLLHKHKSNKVYTSLIQGRFRNNKLKNFKYKVKSDEADHVSKAIDIAAKLGLKAVKGKMDVKGAVAERLRRTFERTLEIQFF